MATFNEEDSNVQIKDDVNILLLGETGIGKSTFINSFINYLQFNTFEEATANMQNINCLIPTKFTVVDDHFNERVLQFGSSVNESTADGESATLRTKTYVFNLPNHDMKVRIIDTPGIGDTRGINQDYINQENIISALSNVKYINAICILLKPNQPRCTISFQYCINQLLICLHKIAVNNVVFVFTNTSTSFFTPGETVHSLQKVLKDIEENQNIIIPFNKDNTFCVDNESFRYLLAQNSDIEIGNEKIFSKSWEHSRNEYLRILKYAIKQTSYSIDHSLYLFKVRNKFETLCQTVTDIVDLLKSDSDLLKKLQAILDNGNSDEVADAKNNMQEIENRISKYKCDKNNYIVQISKLVIFLQTNSIIVFNNYSRSYISYLIDREKSMGLATDRKRVRKLYELMKYHESINGIVNMDMHIDPFSPVMTREELSSIFPYLEEDVNAMYNIKDNEEVQCSINQIDSEENCKKNATEESASYFTFSNWFKVINDAASYITEQIENTIDYEELRKQCVKDGHPYRNNKHNINKNFTKVHSNFNKPNKNESRINNDIKHQWKQNNYRGGKSFNKGCTSKASENLDFSQYEDDFVVLDRPQETKYRDSTQGKSRGRGRGSQGYSQQSHRSANPSKNEQSHNKNRQTQIPRGACKTKHNSTTNNSNNVVQPRSVSKLKRDDNRTTNNPNNLLQPRGVSKTKRDDNITTNNPQNLLQSMKTLFD